MLKSSLVVMIINMISRILGLIREVIIATFFGASGQTDAYFAASRISNFFTTLLGEGSLGTAFIPIYNEIKEKEGNNTANDFVYNITNLIVSITFTISLFMILFSKFILKYLLGFSDTLRLNTSSNLLKIMAFYLMFISISGIMSSLLNNYNKFYISTLVGVVFNLTIIIGTILLNKRIGIYALGISFLFSGIFQVLIQLPSFLKILKNYKFIFDYKNKEIKKFIYIMVPTLIGIFGYQINELIDTRFASSLKVGTISAINYASRLYLLPIGVFAISLSVVVFPNLSKAATKNNNILFKETIQKGLHLLAILIIPSSIGLFYYSKDIVSLIFNYGRFNSENISTTSEILKIYALGLIFFSSIHLLTRAHYAFKNRKIPLITSLIGIVTNIILDFLLVSKYTHIGLTFATSFSATINFLLLYILFNKYYIKLDILKYLKFILISLINSFICLYLVENLIDIGNNKVEIIVKLILFIMLYFSLLSIKYLKDKRKIFDI